MRDRSDKFDVMADVDPKAWEDNTGMSTSVMIEADGLCKQFGAFLAVRDVSFSIPKGQVVAFLGPNGAGKTTTMRLLTGFVAPTHGSARIAGINVQSDRIGAAEHLGYLPENGPLYPDMSPLSLLKFFGEARGLMGPSCTVVSMPSSASVPWTQWPTSRSVNFRKAIGSGSRWPRRCFMTPRS